MHNSIQLALRACVIFSMVFIFNYAKGQKITAKEVEVKEIGRVEVDSDLQVSGKVKSDFIRLSNEERSSVEDVAGVLYYDENYSTNFPDMSGDGGGLAFRTLDDGWGAIIATNNMEWIRPRFNGGTFSGNVTIGKLGNAGNIHFINSEGNNSGYVGFDNASENANFRISNWKVGSSLSFWTNSGSNSDGFLERVRIDENGKAIFYKGQIESPSTGLQFIVNNTERMRIKTNGNIGIGTTSPRAKLEVNGDAFIDGTIKREEYKGYGQEFDYTIMSFAMNQNVRVNNAATGWKVKVVSDRANSTYTEAFKAHDPIRLSFYPGRTTPYGANYSLNELYGSALTLYADKGSSKVGIGTDKPTEKLHVNGKIRATGQVGWSDFVFYEDYELATLEEVEDYIDVNGHLKDIPSEKEVLEDGIDLTEMDSKLLQKIEELTLYLIDQNKQLQQQAEEIATLKEELRNLKD